MNTTNATLKAHNRWFLNAYRPVVLANGVAIVIGIKPTQDRNVAQRAAQRLLAAVQA